MTKEPKDARFFDVADIADRIDACGWGSIPDEEELTTQGLIGGRYRLTTVVRSTIARDIYRATHHQLGHPVQIHILRSHLSRDVGLLGQVKHELSLAACLDSPHAARVIDLGLLADGRMYFAREVGRGHAMSATRARLTAAEVLDLLRQLSDPLDALHRLGGLHGHIGWDALLLSGRGARKQVQLDYPGEYTLRTTEGCLRAALAPEQLTGQTVDSRADIYAVASLAAALLDMVFDTEAEQDNAASARVRLLDVLARATSANPDRRPDSVGALVASLGQTSVHRHTPRVIVFPLPPSGSGQQGSGHLTQGNGQLTQCNTRPRRLTPGDAPTMQRTIKTGSKPV